MTLKKAEEIALAMELPSKHVVDIQSTDVTPSKVHQVNSAARNKGKNPACYHCGEKHEAHPGESRMKVLAQSYVLWPGLEQDIVKKVKGCDKCQAHQSTPAEAPLHPWEWPGFPWSRLHVNYAGPYKGEMFLVVIDAYSKWLEVYNLKCDN